jgi:hypothetical protein
MSILGFPMPLHPQGTCAGSRRSPLLPGQGSANVPLPVRKLHKRRDYFLPLLKQAKTASGLAS